MLWINFLRTCDLRVAMFNRGALVEPVACGLNALRRAGMRRGDRIMVLGAGTMALAHDTYDALQSIVPP